MRTCSQESALSRSLQLAARGELQLPGQGSHYFLGLRSKSSYQTVPKIGQTELSTHEVGLIFSFTASLFAPVLKDKEIRCQSLFPLGAGAEEARVVSSMASASTTIGVAALTSWSVFK